MFHFFGGIWRGRTFQMAVVHQQIRIKGILCSIAVKPRFHFVLFCQHSTSKPNIADVTDIPWFVHKAKCSLISSCRSRAMFPKLMGGQKIPVYIQQSEMCKRYPWNGRHPNVNPPLIFISYLGWAEGIFACFVIQRQGTEGHTWTWSAFNFGTENTAASGYPSYFNSSIHKEFVASY